MKLQDIYLGSESGCVGQSTGFGHHRWSMDNPRAWVLGAQFGPTMLAVGCSLAEAIDEWDERHGQRVDPVADRGDLLDYCDEQTAEQRIASGDVRNRIEACIDAAIDEGTIRVNDGGTMVWVDPYEWVRSFETVKEAGRFFRGGWNR